MRGTIRIRTPDDQPGKWTAKSDLLPGMPYTYSSGDVAVMVDWDTPIRSQGIQDLLDGQTRRLFAMTAAEAHQRGCCVRCRRDIKRAVRTGWARAQRAQREANLREWYLSGLCPSCYDAVTEDCE